MRSSLHISLVNVFWLKQTTSHSCPYSESRISPQTLHFWLRLARFDYSILHVPGKHLYTANTLSRARHNSTTPDTWLIEEAELLMAITVANLPASKQRLDTYKRELSRYLIFSKVAHYCQAGWPPKQGIEHHLKPYWEIWGELTLKDSLLKRGKWIVVLSKTLPYKESTRSSRHWKMPSSGKDLGLVAYLDSSWRIPLIVEISHLNK